MSERFIKSGESLLYHPEPENNTNGQYAMLAVKGEERYLVNKDQLAITSFSAV